MSKFSKLWRSYRLPIEMQRKIESLRSILEACEPQAIADRRFPTIGVEAMVEAGLFKLAVAKEVGGDEIHPVIEMEIHEAIARISVSASWNLLVGNIHTAWASAYLSEEAIAEVFPRGHRTIVAGQAAPVGKAWRVDGGYRVTGHWNWGSGISHCNWVLGGFLVEGEQMVPLVFVMPKRAVNVLDNWHVLGIEGSGSYDYTAENMFVPASHTFEFHSITPKRGGRRYTIPLPAQTAIAHSAVALGGAERALEEISGLAVNKRRSRQQQTLAMRGAFQRDLGEAYIRLTSIRDNAVQLFERMAECAANGDALSERETCEISAMAAIACQLSVEISNMAFRHAGGSSVRLDSPIQRVLRDVLVVQQHFAVADTHVDALGAALINELKPKS